MTDAASYPTTFSHCYFGYHYGQTVHRMLDEVHRPVAVMACADFMARRIANVCRERGWSVGRCGPAGGG